MSGACPVTGQTLGLDGDTPVMLAPPDFVPQKVNLRQSRISNHIGTAGLPLRPRRFEEQRRTAEVRLCRACSLSPGFRLARCTAVQRIAHQSNALHIQAPCVPDLSLSGRSSRARTPSYCLMLWGCSVQEYWLQQPCGHAGGSRGCN